jgi:hypothetical protein
MISQLERLLEDSCPELRVSTCGNCGYLVVSERECRRNPHYARGISPVYMRALGVPFCRGCSTDDQIRHVLQARKLATGGQRCAATSSPVKTATQDNITSQSG